MEDEIMKKLQISTELKDNDDKSPKKPKLTYVDLKKASNTQLENNISEFEALNNIHENLFKNSRKSINDEIDNLLAVLSAKDFKKFINLQSDTLALRQRIQEEIAMIMVRLSKANASYKRAFADRCDYYTTGHGLKVSDGTRTKLIDRDLSERTRGTDLLEAHIEFLRSSSQTCDSIGYTIKNIASLMAYIPMN